MKKILVVILLSIGFVAQSQTWTPVSGRWEYMFVKWDSAARPPLDTIASAPQGSIASKGNTLYIKGASSWTAITGAGGSGVWGFISGSITSQTDLQAALSAKLDTSKRKVDTLYAITDSTFGLYINGQFRTFKARGAIPSFNGRTGAITLAAVDVTNALGYSPLPIGGSTGQALTKNSSTNYDVSWQTVGGGGATDTSSLSNRINAKADTAGGVIRRSDTAYLHTVATTQSDWNEATTTAIDYIKNKPTSMLPAGPAGGDLTGTYPNPALANNAVTNAKSAQMAAHTFKGNNTGSTANAIDLTATQLTAELNVMAPGLKGLAPAPSGSPSSSKYLSEDGTWATPAGGGNVNFSNVFLDSNFAPVVAIGGESNGSGVGADTCALSTELDADPRIQIMQSTSYFEPLNIGAGNNFSGPPSGLHGAELELQNLISTYFNNRTVYLVKAAKGGSTVAQWGVGTANYDTLYTRLSNAYLRLKEMGKIPVLMMLWPQGINDAVAGTNADTWKAATLAIWKALREKFGEFPVVIPELIGDTTTYPQFNAINGKIFEIAKDKDNYAYRIPMPKGPLGLSCTTDSIRPDGIHWEYLGLKAMARRFVKTMVDTAGYIYYERGIKNISQNAWLIGGNRGTNSVDHAVGTLDTAELKFIQNSTERMRISNNGYVGIGKSPLYLLDVNGNIRVNGLLLSTGMNAEATSHNIILAPSSGTTTSGTNNVIADPSGDANNNGFGSVLIGDGTSTGGSDKNVKVRIGFQAGRTRDGHRGIYIGSQVGSGWSGYSGPEDDVIAIGTAATGAWAYGLANTGQAQFNSAATPVLDNSIALDVLSTTRGFAPPRMTASQRTSISSPATGLEVFDTDSLRKMIYNGSAWKAVAWTTDVTGGSSYRFLDKQVGAQNSGTSTTTLYTYTIPANTLSADGDVIDFEVPGALVDNATTYDLSMQLSGSTMLGTGAITIAAASTYHIRGRIFRTGSTTARYTVTIELTDAAGVNSLITGAAPMSSLDWTSGTVLRLQGTASGGGATTGDITGYFWTVEFKR